MGDRPGSPVQRSMTVLVAASDGEHKAFADLVCTGEQDDKVIRRALGIARRR